jgi:hypothetical protein
MREHHSSGISVVMSYLVALLPALFFGLLSLGNAVDLDPDISLSSRGQQIVGEPNLTISDLARDHGDRYQVYVALGEYAPGSSITIHPDVRGLEPLYLHGIANMEQVETRELEAPTMARHQSAVSRGEFRELQWELRVPAGGTAQLYAHPEDDAVVIAALDEGVGDELSSSSTVGSDQGATSRSILRDGLADAAIATLLALFGATAIRGLQLPSVCKASLGLLLGLSALAAVGLLRLSGLGGMAATLALLAGLGLMASRKGQRRPTAIELAVAPLTAMALAVASTFSRALGLVTTSPDSFRYLAGGSAMSAGQLTVESLDAKHMIGQQSLHAPLVSLGVEGFQSLGPIVFLAGLILVFQFSREVTSDLGIWTQRILPVAVTVALGTSPVLWRLAAYVNSHMIFGVLLLSFAYIWYRSHEQLVDRDTAQNLAGLLLVALILLRPEGILVVGLLFVACGTRGAPGPDRDVWKRPWIMAALAAASWNSLLLASGDIELAPVLSLGLAVLLLIAATGITRIAPRFLVAVRRVTATGLWSITAIIFIQANESITFFSAIQENMLEGAGGWGQLGILLALALVVIHVWALFGTFKAEHAAVSWSVTLFLPVILLVKLGDGAQVADVSFGVLTSLLAEGGGRIGWGDSVNRMWTHIALLVPVAMLMGLNELAKRSAAYAARPFTRGALLGATALGLAAPPLLWAPTYIESRWVALTPWIGAALILASTTVAVMRPPPRFEERIGSSLAGLASDLPERGSHAVQGDET